MKTKTNKVIKFYSKLFKREITIKIDERLNNLKAVVTTPEKMEAANAAAEKWGYILFK